MYELVDRLDPDLYHALARATYAEMALAGITAVGEFHYLHHDRDGRRYQAPNAMGEAVFAAAADAGLRITLIDTCYLQAGVDGAPLEGPAPLLGRRRRRLGDAGRGPGRVADSPDRRRHPQRPGRRSGIDGTVGDWARRATRRRCMCTCPSSSARTRSASAHRDDADRAAREGRRARPETTAVHGTHADRGRHRAAGSTGTTVCLCPTTERDLGDGIGPAQRAGRGRLAADRRQRHARRDRPVRGGARARARPAPDPRPPRPAPAERCWQPPPPPACARWAGTTRGLAVGAPADFTTVRLDSPRTAGATADTAVEHLVFAATAADVTDVVVAGRPVVEGGRHSASTMSERP